MRIPINGPAYVFGDNKSVLVNSSKPDFVPKKKNNFIAYHLICEETARDKWRVTYFNTDKN